MTKEPNEPRPLARISAAESEAWRRRSSVRFLECAVHLCATHMSVEEVATLLEAEAAMLRELG